MTQEKFTGSRLPEGITFSAERVVTPHIRFLAAIWNIEVVSIPAERANFYAFLTQDLLETLPPVQRQIVSARFGLSDDEPQGAITIATNRETTRANTYSALDGAFKNARRQAINTRKLFDSFHIAPFHIRSIGRALFGDVTRAEVVEQIPYEPYVHIEDVNLSDTSREELQARGVQTRGTIQMPLTLYAFLDSRIDPENPLPIEVYQELLEALNHIKNK